MPSNAIIGWTNYVLSGSLLAGSQTPGLGINNIKGERGSASTGWQTPAGALTSLQGAWFLVDSGVNDSVWNLCGVFRTNLTTNAVVQWYIGNSFSNPGGDYTSGALSNTVARGYGQSVHVPPAGTRGRYLQCHFTDPSNPDGFINVPLAYTGPGWTPAINLGWGSALRLDDATTETVTRGGQEYPTNLWRRRAFDMDFVGIRDNEVWPHVMELDNYGRAGGNVMLVPNPASTQVSRETIFGRFRATSALTMPMASLDSRAWRATITERL